MFLSRGLTAKKIGMLFNFGRKEGEMKAYHAKTKSRAKQKCDSTRSSDLDDVYSGYFFLTIALVIFLSGGVTTYEIHSIFILCGQQ